MEKEEYQLLKISLKVHDLEHFEHFIHLPKVFDTETIVELRPEIEKIVKKLTDEIRGKFMQEEIEKLGKQLQKSINDNGLVHQKTHEITKEINRLMEQLSSVGKEDFTCIFRKEEEDD